MSTTTYDVTLSADSLRPLSRLLGAAGVMGAAMVLASSLAWVGGEPAARYVLQFYGACGVTLALFAQTLRLTPPLPRLGPALAALTLVGFGAGGVGFAVDGLHVQLMGSLPLADEGGLAGTLAPTLAGALGPLSVVLVAVALWRARLSAPWIAAVLAVGGALFPISRIGEVPLLAVADDVLLVVAFAALGRQLIRDGFAVPADG